MPPDITAGPLIRAGTPPAATVLGKPEAGPLASSASPFALFLAQSGSSQMPAALPPAALVSTETAASPAGTLPVFHAVDPLPALLRANPFANAKLAAASPKTAEKLKTMDTLRRPSLPLGKAKAGAGELLLPPASTDDKNTLFDTLPSAAQSASQSVAAAAVLLAPPVISIVTPAYAPPAAPVLTQARPALLTAEALTPHSPQAQALPAQPKLPQPGSLLDSVFQPLPEGLPLPRTFTLAAPVTPPAPAATPPAAPKVLPQASGLPQNALPQNAVPQNALPAQPIPNAPVPNAPVPNALAAASPIPTAAQSLPQIIQGLPQTLPAAGVVVPPMLEKAGLEPAKPAFGKTAGKASQIALKADTQNADINTRTLPRGASTLTAKTAVLVAAHETAAFTEKHSEAQATALDIAGTSAALLPQTADAAVQGTKVEKPLSAADHAEMVRQVADGVGAMPLPAKPGAAQQMSLQLHPKDWGSLQVSVTVTANQEVGAAKTVTAHIVAETPQVKAALQSQTGALHEALRASGLHLEHLTVSVKAADAKAPEVKPAAQSASAGLSSGQGQPNSSQPGQGQLKQTDLKQTDPSAFGQPAAGSQYTALGTSAGSSHGRQGQPSPLFTPATAGPELEPGEISSINLLRHPVSSRIDMHA